MKIRPCEPCYAGTGCHQAGNGGRLVFSGKERQSAVAAAVNARDAAEGKNIVDPAQKIPVT